MMRTAPICETEFDVGEQICGARRRDIGIDGKFENIVAEAYPARHPLPLDAHLT